MVPGRYTARLTVTPAGGGATTIINRSFNLTKDANQVMAQSDLESLDRFRLGYAKFQESLRPAQERVDSMAAAYAPLKAAADRASDKLTPALKTQLAQLDSAVTDVYCDIGSAGGGRGGRGGGRGGRGAAGGIRCPGQFGFGGGPEDNTPDQPVKLTITQKVQGMAYLTNVTFEPTAEQRSNLASLPGDLRAAEAKLARVRTKDIPAFEAALKAAGVDLSPPARGRRGGRGGRGGR